MVVARGHNIIKVTGPTIRGQRPPQFLVPKGHKILEVTDNYVIYECSHKVTDIVADNLL